MTDTLADITNIEAAEETLERIIYELEDLAEDTHDGELSAALSDLVNELHRALDCLQIGLGRPYLRLLARTLYVDEGDPEPCCKDCGTNTCPIEPDLRAEDYMVTDEVWAAAHMTPNGGYLCIGCLEKRIGRQLTPADFTDALLNNLNIADGRYAWSWRTRRLVSRLSGQPERTTEDVSV